MRILQWLVFSYRPLSVEELAEVVAIDVDREPAFDRDDVFEDAMDVLDICSSLVSVVTTKGSLIRIVALAHYSVQEYLVSARICQGSAALYGMQTTACHGYIAKGSIGYLLQYEKGAFNRFDSAQSLHEACALARYAAKYWMDHTRSAGAQDDMLIHLAMKLLSPGDSAYLNWLRLHNPDEPWEEPYIRSELSSFSNPLYYASLGGVANIACQIIEDGADVNSPRGYYGNALQAASTKGHTQIAELLISKGADINAQGGEYGNALQAASANGHTQIAELLISKGG